MDGGYSEEASAWRDWLVRAAAGSPDQLQIMYGIAGERRLWEWEVPWLNGYEGSKPVRIGNAAHAQLQLDVFGEMMDALYHARRAGLPENEAAWALQLKVLEHLEFDLAGTRQRHLGNAWSATAFHLLQDHGVGCIRSRDQERRGIRHVGTARTVATRGGGNS